MKIIPLASSSSGNAHYISDGVTSLLLDAGLPLKKLQSKLHEHTIFLSTIDGCLVSHSHGDHANAAHDLTKSGIPVFTSRETAEATGLTEWRDIFTDKEMRTFGFVPFPVIHDAPGSVGFYIYSYRTHENLIYLTDTMYSPVKFPPLDIIMVECNYTAEALDASIAAGIMPIEQKPRLVKSHMSLNTLLQLLKANDLTRLKKIYVMHLSDRNSDEAQIRKEIQRLTGAEVIIC